MNYRRSHVFAACCAGMLMFGIVLTTLGAILPEVIPKFGIDKSAAGSLMALLSFGILTGSLVFGPIADRYGYKALLAFCTGLLLVGFEGIALAPSMAVLRLFVFLIGCGGGVINGGTNALVADIAEEGRGAGLNLLGVFFGVGAMGVPLLLGGLGTRSSYQWIIGIVGAAVIFPLVFILTIPFPRPKQEQGFPIRQGLRLLAQPTLLLLGGMLFFQSGMEITTGSWSAVFLQEELGIPQSKAVLYLSFYWLGLVGARLALGFWLKPAYRAAVMRLALALAFVGALMTLLASRVELAVAGLLLVGAGFAGIFPIVLSFVGDAYGTLSGTAFSIAFVMALTGGMTLPALAGVIGDAHGLRTSFVLIPLGLLCVAALFTIVKERLSGKTEQM
ncbi:MAG: MFS transporter [candidate division KSB1 bacterium]|nr:MFS transporter [candidate division KSB1 bacterium]